MDMTDDAEVLSSSQMQTKERNDVKKKHWEKPHIRLGAMKSAQEMLENVIKPRERVNARHITTLRDEARNEREKYCAPRQSLKNISRIPSLRYTHVVGATIQGHVQGKPGLAK
eukprot:snap_masked-scaffold_2-processed-gene-23.47-mRNA-1 protein AED:1.00 eAED:1.00 QI:0/-1/0/0/-1/1/1/0/112